MIEQVIERVLNTINEAIQATEDRFQPRRPARRHRKAWARSLPPEARRMLQPADVLTDEERAAIAWLENIGGL